MPIELKQWVNEWIFLGLSLDYASGSMFIFVKSFSSLGNEMKTVEKISFGDFKLKDQYEIVMGGIERKNYQNFKGALFDWNLSTFYLGTVTEFVYLITGKSSVFSANGVLFGSDFSLSGGKFVSKGFYKTKISNTPELQSKINNGVQIEGRVRRVLSTKGQNFMSSNEYPFSNFRSTNPKYNESESIPTLNRSNNKFTTQNRILSESTQVTSTHIKYTQNNKPYFSSFQEATHFNKPRTFSKTIPFTNSKEYIQQKVYGARFSFKDSMTLTGLLLGSNNIPQIEVITPGVEKPINSASSFYIKKFVIFLNFSFKEIVGDELIIFSSASPNSENGFYVSLVEKAKEEFYKQFFSDGIQVLPANYVFPNQYTYDSSQNKPKVLKLHVTASNGKKLTFISPINIIPERQYRVTLGFYSYPPGILRVFFQFENKFIFTHEEGDLDFIFSDQEVALTYFYETTKCFFPLYIIFFVEFFVE